MPGPREYEIFMDGGCPFCQWARARTEPFDTAGRLRFHDYTDPGVAAQVPFSREELDKELHVRAPGGTWHTGFDGCVVVLRAMPLLAWLGWALSTSLFRDCGLKLYAWVAKNRNRLPGHPPACRADAGSGMSQQSS